MALCASSSVSTGPTAATGSGETLNDIFSSMTDRISDLKTMFLLRDSDQTGSDFDRSMNETSTTVRAVELEMANMKQLLIQERQALEEMKLLLPATVALRERVVAVGPALPNCLPGCSYAEAKAAPKLSSGSSSTKAKGSENINPAQPSKSTTVPPKTSAPTAPVKSSGKKKSSEGEPVPEVLRIAYVMVDEFEGVPKYIKGRITRDQVNAVIDSLFAAMKAKYAVLALPTTKMSDINAAKYKSYKEADLEELRGLCFLVDEDLKSNNIKLDPAGRSILTILRHLGRIREVRGGGLVRYVQM